MNEERDVIGEVIAEDNARPIHPAVAEYAVSILHTAPSDGVRVAELELLNAELWRQNEELTQRLADTLNAGSAVPDGARVREAVKALNELARELDDRSEGSWAAYKRTGEQSAPLSDLAEGYAARANYLRKLADGLLAAVPTAKKEG